MLKGMARAAAVLLAINGVHAHANSCVWFSHDDSIRQVQTASNLVTRIVPLRDPRRLVMNAEDCGVWTIDSENRRLLRFGAEGALEREIRVRDLDPRIEDVKRLHVDPYDGSLWITDERRVFHLSPDGHLLGGFSAPGSIQHMEVALDQTVWILGKRDLWHFDATGNLLASLTLGRYLSDDARFFAIDNLGGLIWLGGDNEISQLKLASPAETPLRIKISRDIADLALDPYSGKVWMAQEEKLVAYGRDGALAHTVGLDALNIRKPKRLAFDPASRSLWVGAERSVSRFTDTGQFVIAFSARAGDGDRDGDGDGNQALGVPVFKVQPTLSLIRPPQDALTNNPQPEFRLSYGADCNGVPCGFFSGSYFSGYQLSAILNNQPVGSAFLFNPSSNEASYSPPARLPEGANSFTAQVKDSTERKSNTVSNTFTIDTIAPRFLSLSPIDGSVFQTSQAVLQGTIDDPLGTVVLNNLGLSRAGASFAFPVVLQPGVNVFTLSAIDRAGNAKSVAIHLSFSSLSVLIDAPLSGTSVNSDRVLVTGTFGGPQNTGVSVNGVVAAIANNRFYAQVPLALGSNVVTASATPPDGAAVSHAITVTSAGFAPITITPSVNYGVAPQVVSFDLGNRTGRTLKLIEADYDGDGSFELSTADPSVVPQFTYSTPGVYTALFRVTDEQNIVYTANVIVQIEDTARLDQVLRATWSSFTQALAARNKDAAMAFLNGSAQERYGRVFDALRATLPALAASISSPTLGQVTGGVGEYFITRSNPDGTTRLFLIYFVRSADGVWRIDSM